MMHPLKRITQTIAYIVGAYPCGRPLSSNGRPLLLLCMSLILTLLLSACGFPGLTTTSQQLPQANQTPEQSPLPPLRLPQDESAHNDLTEWWYYTGHFNATDPAGKLHHYGFELVIFQALRSDLPPVYASHFAISDITRGEFHYDQLRQTEVNASIPNGTSNKGFDIHIGDWSIRGLNGQDHVTAAMKDYAINLDLSALKPPTLYNGTGLGSDGLGGFSYYYSRTRMEVTGSLTDHNQPMHVTGLGWMDHQWGNFLTLGGGGWDWYSMQLNNNAEIMLYIIRGATGQIISTYASYIDANANNHIIRPNAVSTTVLDHWTSPVTGITYPSGWRIVLNDPQIQVTLTVTPQLKNQELVTYQSTGNVYWEGATNIQGQVNNKPTNGEGYVELTGYTKP